ncbi:hypothetical protein ETH_00036275 [Eimeria tenella]|uniref:Uncharacterized protein n=1 Tax=Eimeria tenella TaxID=5802 RepID=U6L781_EIMTE|nr:hypothetical protein ETH_00036275 [Eimeria tenella]CDJ44409.1 hypothetical protein ETH_00036275 [Eimeria tenella]|eukprot:XP_013235158.1 hypothetical protein ETH_00036275 [Eimeria tenella]
MALALPLLLRLLPPWLRRERALGGPPGAPLGTGEVSALSSAQQQALQLSSMLQLEGLSPAAAAVADGENHIGLLMQLFSCCCNFWLQQIHDLTDGSGNRSASILNAKGEGSDLQQQQQNENTVQQLQLLQQCCCILHLLLFGDTDGWGESEKPAGDAAKVGPLLEPLVMQLAAANEWKRQQQQQQQPQQSQLQQPPVTSGVVCVSRFAFAAGPAGLRGATLSAASSSRSSSMSCVSVVPFAGGPLGGPCGPQGFGGP